MPGAFDAPRPASAQCVRGSRLPLWLFAGSLAALYTAALLIAPALPRLESPQLVASALSLDLTLVVCLLFYLLVVRQLRWPLPSVAALFVLSLLAAEAIIPAAYGGLLVWLGYLALPLELYLLGCIARRANLSLRALGRKARSASAAPGGDLLSHLREAARESFGPPLAAELLASELALFCYAFQRTAGPAAAGQNEALFSYHRECNYGSLLSAVLVLLGFELIAVHFLVAALWSQLAAWILSALSAYAALWLLADYKACVLRPIELAGGTLRLRLGLRWTAELPIAQIREVCDTAPAAESGRVLPIHLSAEPKLWLVLSEPLVARGPYGIRRSTSLIALGPDEPARLARLLREGLAERPEHPD